MRFIYLQLDVDDGNEVDIEEGVIIKSYYYDDGFLDSEFLLEENIMKVLFYIDFIYSSTYDFSIEILF